MDKYGLTVKHDVGSKRIEMRCLHQNGLLYVVPGESSWVCAEEYLHAHALAGFFSQLEDLEDSRVQDLLQRWGLYYRSYSVADSELEA